MRSKQGFTRTLLPPYRYSFAVPPAAPAEGESTTLIVEPRNLWGTPRARIYAVCFQLQIRY